MSDIIANLRRFVADPGASHSYLLSSQDAADILAEVDHLRSLAGAVSPGPSLADIKAKAM